MSEYRTRAYRRKTTTPSDDSSRLGRQASSRFKQFQQGFSLPYRSAGRPDKALFQLIGLLASIGLIYVVVDAVTYGLNAPSIRANMPRTPAKAISYRATELVIDFKNKLVTGETGATLPVPDEYTEAAIDQEKE